jgi:hypothetical protein
MVVGIKRSLMQQFIRSRGWLDVSEWEGIYRSRLSLTKASMAETKHTLKIKRGRHYRKAMRTLKQRVKSIHLDGETHVKAACQTKTPKLRGQRPSSYSSYGRLTLGVYRIEHKRWNFETARIEVTGVSRHPLPEMRKLKGPRLEIYNPKWEW